ncbi:LPP20 family lipoprotein [Enterovibrio baiacu]|uniref:LPP20 family lipoprotein n=1 Tax=Enterovibrio baiacu TaxID=2491023 RepID=UPI003D1385C9
MKIWLMLAMVMLLNACQPITRIRSDDVLTAVGTASVTAQRGDTLEEKQFRAMRASKLEAYKELSEQVYGVRVSGLTQVDDQALGVDKTHGAVDGIIRAAEVVSTYQVGDSYVTELELNLRKMKKMTEYGESHHVPRNDAILF